MKVWEDFLTTLESELGTQTVDFWLRPLKVRMIKEGALELVATDSFQILWFEEHVRPLAETKLYDEIGRKWSLTFAALNADSHDKANGKKGKFEPKQPGTSKFDKANNQNKGPFEAKTTPGAYTQTQLEIKADALDPNCTFELIEEYSGNRLAYRALKHLAADPALFVADGYNPFYIYGPAGSGKSSLMMACAQELRQAKRKVLYVRGETFTQHVVQAIRLGMMQEFRRFYRGIDVLFLDGVEIFSHKVATQEEFFHTFNSLHVEAKAIVLAAKVAPKDLKEIEARLISRFEWGLMASIEPAQSKELETLIINHCTRLRLALNGLQIKWIIDEFGSSMAQIVKALTTLSVRAHRQRVQVSQLDVPTLNTLLQDLRNEQAASTLTSEKISQIVSDFYGITTKDLLGKCQRREFSLPRQVAMYLCREKLQMPFLKIAHLFGRDHSTVMASCKLINKQLHEKQSRIGQEMPLIYQKL